MDQVPGTPDQQPAASGLPSCYRHPGRETGIRCNRCDRPICPDCMVSASVGFQCPNCVREGSGTGHAPAANQPRTLAGGTVAADPRLVTKILIGLNVAVFVAVLSKVFGDHLVDDYLLVGRWPPAPYAPTEGVADGEWYRLFTSMFLHEQFWHIGFNMVSLWLIGGPLEAALGRVRYLTLYLVSGLFGSALTYLIASPTQGSLGASGAVFGLFGATAVLMKRMNYDMRPLIGMLVINLIFTFSGGIAWQAHIGGFVAGIVIAIGMVYAPRERRSLVQYGTCALVLAVTVALVLMRTAALT
ncbi:rhomboid family intramembrane serine protease [Streptomyces beijiangensis]|uniref:Rhomboid family intramembrane serine protease n=1 Tax=Streptomyces beijiangensis TaxID=163361 RepID=A0A939FAY9_9ACTN|nr:rhomboid family intramembrane serine protease [Streptomyces beijiangensis]MBO0515901.1 rhomboid family intramembrane serine protease [Streptomyces beijiangensis]